MRMAISRDGKVFGAVEKRDTPKHFEDAIEMIASFVKAQGAEGVLRAVGGGIAGSFNKEKTTLVYSPNLPLWNGVLFADMLASRLGAVPVFLENDTAVVGLGEAHKGAGKGSAILAYVTVSTGVNGVRIVDGAIDRSTYGFEIGHQILDVDTTYLGKGLWEAEDILSGTALEKRMGVKPYDVHDVHVWEELARILAMMLYNTILYWSPDTIVLGGSMVTGSPAISLERVEHHISLLPRPFPMLPTLKKAELDDVGGVWGALQVLSGKGV